MDEVISPSDTNKKEKIIPHSLQINISRFGRIGWRYNSLMSDLQGVSPTVALYSYPFLYIFSVNNSAKTAYYFPENTKFD